MSLIRDILFLLILVSTVSCGLPTVFQDVKESNFTRQFATSNPEFDSYKAKFEQEGKQRLSEPNFAIGDIPINFGDTEGENYQGICIKYSDGTREIIIKKSWWDQQNQYYRESLIFHELGHCRLDRDHDNHETVINNNSYKTSMMNQYIVAPNLYRSNKDAYLEELFTFSTTSLITSLSTP